jgi:predicted anti-sigma-YlaC factor YlaD
MQLKPLYGENCLTYSSTKKAEEVLMNCETFEILSDDLTDSALSDQSCHLMKEHLKVCCTCRSKHIAILELRSQIALLPRILLPQKDLWLEIEKSIKAHLDSARLHK